MILVVGYGGNGQTYFMNFLNKNNIKTNHIYDRDRLKHISNPNNNKIKKKISEFNKIIFLYNEPLKAIFSLNRRKFIKSQLKKLGNPYKINFENLKQLFKLTNEKNKDIFGIEYQFNNWVNSNLNKEILFLNFNEVLENKELLNKFIEKKLNFNLFSIKKRKNNNVNNKVNENIINIYNNLYNYINNKSNEYNDKLIKNL